MARYNAAGAHALRHLAVVDLPLRPSHDVVSVARTHARISGIELKENSVKNECANALRAYGLRAGFAVEQLKTLAKTSHWPTASTATCALQAIDPEAAVKAGIRR